MRKAGRVLSNALAAAAALVAAYFVVGVGLWCWEGAYNVLQGDPPYWSFAVILALAGLAPFVTAWFSYRVNRRHGESRASSAGYTSVVTLLVTLVVAYFRAATSFGGFF